MISKLATFAVLLTTPLLAETPREAADKIAAAAGLADFGTVKKIDFTFNVDTGEKTVKRAWSWEPMEGKVTLVEGAEGKPVTYVRSEITPTSDEALRKVDGDFVNDSYWLIFPFQVVWDSSVTLEGIPAESRVPAAGTATGIRVRYPQQGGYTPGDVYDIYYNDNHMVTHWAYFPQGGEKPKLVTAWEDYQKKGPLHLSMNRPAPEGPFKIWFSGVTVE